MSVEWLTWALKQKVGDARAKFVLVVLANYADENGYSWPSQQQIVKSTDQSERTVRDALKRLEENGFVQREDRRRKNGSRLSTGYQLVMGLPAIGAGGGLPANYAGTYRQTAPVHIEDTKGLHVNKPPYPLKRGRKAVFDIEHCLTDADRREAWQAAGRLDLHWLFREFNFWVLDKQVEVRKPVPMFMAFIKRKAKEASHG